MINNLTRTRPAHAKRSPARHLPALLGAACLLLALPVLVIGLVAS